MKRKIFYLAFVLLFLNIGCRTSKFESKEKKLEFTGNPTTGYIWFFEIEDESIIQVEETINYLGEKKIVGAPSLFMYKIKSLKPGITTLCFQYKRPWENNNPEKDIFYDVKVNSTGKISITKRKTNSY